MIKVHIKTNVKLFFAPKSWQDQKAINQIQSTKNPNIFDTLIQRNSFETLIKKKKKTDP